MNTPVECEGAPRDLGWDQGRACRTALRAQCTEIGPWARLRARMAPPRTGVARALRDLRRHFPHQAEQLEGIARGAGLPMDVVGRAMLTALDGAACGASLAVVRADAARVARPVPVSALLRRTRPDGRFRTLELSGSLLTTPLLGVNEAGLAVACDPGPRAPGVCAAPGALLARDCLERFADVEAALAWCLERPAAGRAAILLADARGAAAGVALAAGERRVLRQTGGLLLGSEDARVAAELAKSFGGSAVEPAAAASSLAAVFGPDVPPFAWADPSGRRLRTPEPGAVWIDV